VFVAISWQIRFDMTIWFVIIILVTGLVGASRLILEEHKPSQIYMGFFTGLLIQLSMFMMVQEI
jgi:membrane-associated phospholipid phosphatase